MHETADDLRALQQLLDDSRARAGTHLASIFTPELALSAEALAELMTGVRVLALATVTARSEPRVGPVDGLFYRGHWWFGSSPDSVRFAHIRRRPQVSAAHTEGEELAVVVHGVAHEVDVTAPERDGFRRYLVEVYGGDWEDWGAGAPYAWIEPTRMWTRRTPVR